MSLAARASDWPPLLSGKAVASDPFGSACRAAADGIDGGTVFHGVGDDRLDAAIVLAPEAPLSDALPVMLAVGLGLADAVGALAPPEVAVHLGWAGDVLVNGATAGRLRVAASNPAPDAVPDWLVVGAELAIAPTGADPGRDPGRTSLHDEGGGDVTAPDLTLAFARHTMSWLHVFLTDGFRPVHEAWLAKAAGLGETVTAPSEGVFTGLDERGGLLLGTEGGTRLFPLTDLLET